MFEHKLWSGSVKHPGLDLNTWCCLVNNIQWFIDHRQHYECDMKCVVEMFMYI